MVFSKSDRAGESLGLGPRSLDFFLGATPTCIYLPQKAHGGGLTSPILIYGKKMNLFEGRPQFFFDHVYCHGSLQMTKMFCLHTNQILRSTWEHQNELTICYYLGLGQLIFIGLLKIW